MTSYRSAFVPALGLALTACSPSSSRNEAEPAPVSNEEAVSVSDNAVREDVPAIVAEAHKSILRPEIVEPVPEAPPLVPLDAIVAFGTSGLTLDEEGRKVLDAALASPAFQAGGRIIVRGHSDTRGADADNLVTSRKRAEAVRAYLLAKGVAADRIDVIALGETRPIAPNAQPDGRDDPEGRAKNRRVEVSIALPPAKTTAVPAVAPAAGDRVP
ncbi:OmpA family protein [Sphingomonas sp. AP4-R1]|uniref:OmpA family protein n=1 Tax=Sphingomonas sp. AP4-R1 TaxID=2735134 RepID=UPI001493CD1B|nr:OmpA family protein [Sphingomonas sp. AP4-R1]QJU58870.1 OmpA family protein [Sphingomonas sp. AP4-R1]